MTNSLTIHSPFNDLTELVEGLAPFYTGEHLVLRAPGDVAEGEWVRFEVLLTDGTAGLTGLGRHAGTNDNGEDFGAERFDVYLGELQLDDGRSEVLWERIVLAFQQAQGGDQPTGEIDISQLEAQQAAIVAPEPEPAPEPVSDDTAAEEPAPAFADFESDAATAAGPISDVPPAMAAAPEAEFEEALEEVTPRPAPAPAPVAARAAARPAAPVAPPAASVRASGPLTRPTLPASWAPIAEPPQARPSPGYFAYGDRGLPVPAHPPRPDGEVRRIEPAPRPQAT